MLRSFEYAAETAARDFTQRFAEAQDRASAAANAWLQVVSRVFLEAYESSARGSSIWVRDEATRRNLLRLHLLAKALYEINYEADHRPDWVEIPIRGVMAILDQAGESA
jgi:maltose alpha-D-glucosyltransferase/alpha-amylase